MMTKKNRKARLKYLGLTDDKAGYKKLQKKYGLVVDGIYGKKTDIVLWNAYACKRYAPHFELEEWSDGGEYPCKIKKRTFVAAETIRNHYGKPMILTSGLRKKSTNAQTVGAVANSAHTKGLAFDYYIKGVTDTLAHRKAHIKWLKKNIKKFSYAYGDGYTSNGNYVSAPNMGNACHCEVK